MGDDQGSERHTGGNAAGDAAGVHDDASQRITGTGGATSQRIAGADGAASEAAANGRGRGGTAGGVHTSVVGLLGSTSGDLVAGLAAARRAENLAMFEQLRVVAALWETFWPDNLRRRTDARRRRRDTSRESLREGLVISETAACLGLTENSAGLKVTVAVALLIEQRLPVAAEWAARGGLDWIRLKLLVVKTSQLTPGQARIVEAEVLTPARVALTYGRFEDVIDRAVIAIDPTAAERRRTGVVEGRSVSFWKDRNGTDGLDAAATLSADGPAVALAAAHAALDASARWLRDHGDTRTLDQLRHDLLVAGCTTGALPVPQSLITATLGPLDPHGPVEPGGSPVPRQNRCTPPTPAPAAAADQAGSHRPARTAGPTGSAGQAETHHPARTAGPTGSAAPAGSPGPAGATNWAGATAAPRPTPPTATPARPTDPTPTTSPTGTTDQANTTDPPRSTDPRRSTDPPRSTEPAGSTEPGAAVRSTESTGSTGAEPAAAGDGGVVAMTAGRPQVPVHLNVTVTLQTLLGMNDHPGRLDGYGPIPAHLVRDLATHAIWRCTAVDDTHGTVLGVGTKTYTPGYVPGKRLREFLGVAAPTCEVPWCNARAERCDLDHRIPHAHGGATCACNVGPLCRRHHRQKSAGELTSEPSTDPTHPPGTMIWITRTGQRIIAYPYAPLPPEAYAVSRPTPSPVPVPPSERQAEAYPEGLPQDDPPWARRDQIHSELQRPTPEPQRPTPEPQTPTPAKPDDPAAAA